MSGEITTSSVVSSQEIENILEIYYCYKPKGGKVSFFQTWGTDRLVHPRIKYRFDQQRELEINGDILRVIDDLIKKKQIPARYAPKRRTLEPKEWVRRFCEYNGRRDPKTGYKRREKVTYSDAKDRLVIRCWSCPETIISILSQSLANDFGVVHYGVIKKLQTLCQKQGVPFDDYIDNLLQKTFNKLEEQDYTHRSDGGRVL